MQEKFGVHAINQRCFVTNEPKIFDNFAIIPASIGFKQRDGSWKNVFVDLKCFKENIAVARTIRKKQQVTVNGRLEFSEWEDKQGQLRPQWAILVETLEVGAGAMAANNAAPSRPVRQAPEVMEDAPF